MLHPRVTRSATAQRTWSRSIGTLTRRLGHPSSICDEVPGTRGSELQKEIVDVVALLDPSRACHGSPCREKRKPGAVRSMMALVTSVVRGRVDQSGTA